MKICFIWYDDDMKVYKFNLKDDLDNGDLEILRVCVKDFLKTKISHLYIDEEIDMESWWEAFVMDVDVESEDLSNPDFFVAYENCGDDENDGEEDHEYYMCELLEDYTNGDVKFP